jgi:acetyltransferase-like isoleucine patch superfamily enzyme
MMINRIKQFFKLNVIKTLYFNFRMLPFKHAIKLPVLINYRTELVALCGKVTINVPVRTGMIQFNHINDEFLGYHHWRRIEIYGEVVFNGKVDFGVGSVLFVRKSGVVEFGDNVIVCGKSRILCEDSIFVGNNVRIAHESQIMDSNFHYVKCKSNDFVEKCTSSVKIGNNNWIGNRTTIMKGTKTPDFTIVGSNSLLNKDYTIIIKTYSIIGGVPARFIASGYERVFDLNEERIYDKQYGRKLK